MKKKIKFGVCSDLHVQLTAYAEKNLKDFLDACHKENVDFIIQLGDFNMGTEGFSYNPT